MPEQPISKSIFQTLGIFLAVAVVAVVGIFLYNTFGVAFTVAWGIAVVLIGLLYTGVLTSVFKGKK